MQYDEVDLDNVKIDSDPYEIHIDDIKFTHCTEAYMVLQMSSDGV